MAAYTIVGRETAQERFLQEDLRSLVQGRLLMSKGKRGHHRSVDKELRPSVSWLESLSEVQKVVLNQTECARHAYSPGTLRYQMDAPGGIKMKAYGGNGVIDIYVKVDADDKDSLLKKLKGRWDV